MEKLEHTGPAEKERVASVPQSKPLASTTEPLCQKEKEQSHLSRAPDREAGESQGEREPHLGGREEGLEREHGEKSVDSAVKKRRFQGGEGGQAKITSLEKVVESMSG